MQRKTKAHVMRSCFLTLLCVAPLVGTPASAQESLSLAPSSKWVLEYEKERCRIGRFFGEGDERTVLFFEQYAPDSQLRWIVAGKPLKNLRKNSEASWRYGSTGEWTQVSVRGMSLDGYGTALTSDGEIAEERTDRPQPAVEDRARTGSRASIPSGWTASPRSKSTRPALAQSRLRPARSLRFSGR